MPSLRNSSCVATGPWARARRGQRPRRRANDLRGRLQDQLALPEKARAGMLDQSPVIKWKMIQSELQERCARPQASAPSGDG